MDRSQIVYDYPAFFTVILSVAVMIAGVWFIHKVLRNTIEQDLVKIVCYLAFIIALVWACDKMIVVRRNILTPDESKEILGTLKTLITMIFTTYIINAQKKKNDRTAP